MQALRKPNSRGRQLTPVLQDSTAMHSARPCTAQPQPSPAQALHQVRVAAGKHAARHQAQQIAGRLCTRSGGRGGGQEWGRGWSQEHRQKNG